MTTPSSPGPAQSGPPTVAEIAALTARLRELTARGGDVDPAERAAFLADKDALIARIPADPNDTANLVEQAHRATAQVRQPCCRPIDVDGDRRAQLAAWHAEDQTGSDSTSGRDHDPVAERGW